jgi:hypothetical protein
MPSWPDASRIFAGAFLRCVYRKEAISVSIIPSRKWFINGAIRDEIGLNYKVGAMGPFAHANTTIGRAWSLISINLAGAAKSGRRIWALSEIP